MEKYIAVTAITIIKLLIQWFPLLAAISFVHRYRKLRSSNQTMSKRMYVEVVAILAYTGGLFLGYYDCEYGPPDGFCFLGGFIISFLSLGAWLAARNYFRLL